MLCTGLVRVADVGVDIGTQPCRIFVVSLYEGEDLPSIECHHDFKLAQALGILPKPDKLEVSAVVGTFIAVPTDDLNSPWSFTGKKGTVCRIVDPLLFIKPMPLSTFAPAKIKIFADPARPLLPFFTSGGEKLIFPLCGWRFNNAKEGDYILIPINDRLKEMIFEVQRHHSVNSIVLVHNNMTNEFAYEDDNSIVYSDSHRGYSEFMQQNVQLPTVRFNLRQRL